MDRNMIKFVINEYSEGKVMITRKERIDPPIKGLPPDYTSSICMKDL